MKTFDGLPHHPDRADDPLPPGQRRDRGRTPLGAVVSAVLLLALGPIALLLFSTAMLALSSSECSDVSEYLCHRDAYLGGILLALALLAVVTPVVIGVLIAWPQKIWCHLAILAASAALVWIVMMLLPNDALMALILRN